MAQNQTQNRIILEFEDAEALHLALEHIGDPDAPVMILRGEAVVDGQVFELWDRHEDAMKERRS